jgi:hypothetical protein
MDFADHAPPHFHAVCAGEEAVIAIATHADARAAGADRSAAVKPSRTTITHLEPPAERWLRLTFGDGAVHEVDLAGLLQAGGVCAPRARGSFPSLLLRLVCADLLVTAGG